MYVYVLYTQLNTIQNYINYYLWGDNYHHMAVCTVKHVISNESIHSVSHVLSLIAYVSGSGALATKLETKLTWLIAECLVLLQLYSESLSLSYTNKTS